MKSQTLSQFQSVMQELSSFARTAGAKDKAKRKGKGAAIAGGVGVATAGGYGASTVARAAKQKGIEKAALGRQAGFVDKLKKNAFDPISKKGAKEAGVNLIKQADDFASKGGIAKRAVGIAKADAGKVKGAVTSIGKKVLGKILRRGK